MVGGGEGKGRGHTNGTNRGTLQCVTFDLEKRRRRPSRGDPDAARQCAGWVGGYNDRNWRRRRRSVSAGHSGNWKAGSVGRSVSWKKITTGRGRGNGGYSSRGSGIQASGKGRNGCGYLVIFVGVGVRTVSEIGRQFGGGCGGVFKLSSQSNQLLCCHRGLSPSCQGHGACGAYGA